MDRIKRVKNKDYTVISNVFLRDKNLSAKAKGVLSMIMGLPDDWDFSIRGICSIAKEGKTAIYNIIAELKNNGYCESITLRNEVSGVVVGADYSFAEEPIFSPTYTLAQLNKAKKVVLLSKVLDKLKSLNLNSEELNPVNLNSVILNMGFETQLNTKDIKYLLNQLLKDKSILGENENLSNDGLVPTLQDQEETPPPVAVAPPTEDLSFDCFWRIYDKKVGKTKAISQFAKLKLSDLTEMFNVLSSYIESRPDKQYRPDPERFLRNRVWEDEIITPNTKQQSNGSRPKEIQRETSTGGFKSTI